MNEALLRADAFLIEVDGIALGGFASCSGLESSRRVFAWDEGGSSRWRLFDDGCTPGRLRLERAVGVSRALWDWFRAGDSRDGSVVAIDAQGAERARWRFHEAIPLRWQGPELDAESGSIACECLEILYEELRWATS